MRQKLLLTPLLLATLAMSACAIPHQYSAAPIEAWIVDAETSQPIEGVAVVAHWQLEGGFEGGNNMGQMMVMEAVTDPAGRFSFPAWGPKWTPVFSWMNSNARLKSMDPVMILFKSSYEYLGLMNPWEQGVKWDKKPYLRASQWNGKTIKMKKFVGDLKGYASHLSHLSISIDFAMDNCDWKKIPRMLVAVDKQEQVFRKNNVYSSLPSIDYFTLGPRGQCGSGSAQEFFKDYLK